MKKLILSFVAIALATTAFAQKKGEMMSWEEATAKATEVLATLSLDEKIEMTHGHNKFFLPGAPAKDPGGKLEPFGENQSTHRSPEKKSKKDRCKL